MKQKKAFAVTLELVLVILLCGVVAGICIAVFTDNLSDLFSNDRHYKGLFERKAD